MKDVICASVQYELFSQRSPRAKPFTSVSIIAVATAVLLLDLLHPLIDPRVKLG